MCTGVGPSGVDLKVKYYNKNAIESQQVILS
jgi:hypothetical protein